MPPGGLGLSMSGGTLQNLPAAASREEQINALNDVINRLNSMLKSQIFSDGTTKRMIIGFQKNGWGEGKDFGIKVSIPGVDVNNAAENELLFKMDLATWTYYDPDTHLDIGQIGILPDGEGGMAWAKKGESVNEAFGV